jgi:neutral ceramidase
MGLKAGAAKVDVTPVSPCNLAGYGGRDHTHEGVHDAIYVRALYVKGEQGEGLILSGDILWYHEAFLPRLLGELEKQLGVPKDCVFSFGTHTHSAPAVSRKMANRQWVSTLEASVLAAASLAKMRSEDAVLSEGRGSCGIGINRREQVEDGSIILGKNPDGPIDRELILLCVNTPEGKPIARLCNFACHGVVLSGRNYFISGDWPGHAASLLEEKLDCPFLFFNGGAANVNPVIGPQESFEPVAEHAIEFVSSVDSAGECARDLDEEAVVTGSIRQLELPRKLQDVEDGMGKTRAIAIQGLRVGPLRLVGFPGEVFSQTTMAVKCSSPHDLTMVGSYACGGSGGYVPVDEAYDTGGYEVKVSPYATGAEAILRQGFSDLLSDLA